MGTAHKRRILVAVRPRGATRIANALACDFALTFCHSLAQAQSLVANGHFDLVVCGVNFDESRMFDLLKHVKSHPSAKAIPFLCIKVFEGILHAGSYESVKGVCALLGATDFIDFAQWRKELGKEQAAEELRSTLHRFVGKASGTAPADGAPGTLG